MSVPADDIPKIMVVDANSARASIIVSGLRSAGYTDVVLFDAFAGIAVEVERIRPDIIVMDLGNPDRDMMEHAIDLTRAVRRPIAMFVDRSDRAMTAAAIDAGVSAYVVDGLKAERIRPVLEMAVSRFNAFSRLERELREARDELAARKLIEKAKGILMRQKGLSEEASYALLRKTAMNQNRRIVEIAQSLIMASSLLGGEES